jgi:hyperosmotically inducible protein
MNRRTMGWVAVLAVIGMISGGCARSESQTGETRTATDSIRDASTTAAVKLSLAFERGVRAVDISVDTDRGTVTLEGEVRTQAERQLAVKVAEDVAGVKEVVNHIHVRS